MPLPSPPFHEPEAIKHPVADGKEPSIGEILPVILGPNITGNFSLSEMRPVEITNGAFYTLVQHPVPNTYRSSGSGSSYVFGFNAHLSNSIYNRSNSVQPSSLVLNYIVKY